MAISATMRLLGNELKGIEFKWGKIPLENVKSAIYSAFFDKIRGAAYYSRNKESVYSKEELEIQWYNEFIETAKLIKDEKDTETCHKIFKEFIENTTMRYLGLEALADKYSNNSISLLNHMHINVNSVNGDMKSTLSFVKFDINDILEKSFKPMKKEPINTLVFSKLENHLNGIAPNDNPNFNIRKYGIYIDRDPYNNTYDFEKVAPYDTKNMKLGLNFDMAIMNGVDNFSTIILDPFDDKADKLYNYKNYFLYLFRHLKKGAPIFVTLNTYSLRKDTVLFLSNYIDNISVHYSKRGNVIVIYGTKKAVRTPNSKEFNDIIFSLIVGEEKSFDGVIEFLNNSDKEIIFEYLYYDESTIIDMISKSPSKAFNLDDKILENMQLKKTESRISPPLPLNPGQIGLVLVSGHMDGLVDADGSTPHLISGNVFKKRDMNITHEDQNIINKCTSYYSTLITIVDNKGDFKFIS